MMASAEHHGNGNGALRCGSVPAFRKALLELHQVQQQVLPSTSQMSSSCLWPSWGGGGGTRPHQGVAAAVATGISQQQHIVLHVWPPRDLVVGSHGRRRYARGLWEEGNECTRGERSRERSCNSLFRPRRTSGDALMGPLT